MAGVWSQRGEPGIHVLSVLSAPSRSESLVKGPPAVSSAFSFVAPHAHQCSGWGPCALMLPLGSWQWGARRPSPALTLCQTVGPGSHADAQAPSTSV